MRRWQHEQKIERTNPRRFDPNLDDRPMRLVPLIAMALAGMILAGCDGEKAHSVDWYKAHETERLAKLKQCEANPGELEHAPNCVNATQAEAEVSLGPSNDTSIPRIGGATPAPGGH